MSCNTWQVIQYCLRWMTVNLGNICFLTASSIRYMLPVCIGPLRYTIFKIQSKIFHVFEIFLKCESWVFYVRLFDRAQGPQCASEPDRRRHKNSGRPHQCHSPVASPQKIRSSYNTLQSEYSIPRSPARPAIADLKLNQCFLMLVHRLRRSTNIKSALVRVFVFAGILQPPLLIACPDIILLELYPENCK